MLRTKSSLSMEFRTRRADLLSHSYSSADSRFRAIPFRWRRGLYAGVSASTPTPSTSACPRLRYACAGARFGEEPCFADENWNIFRPWASQSSLLLTARRGFVSSVEKRRKSKMSSVRDCVSAMMVADAASMGLHWIYDGEKLDEVKGDGPAEFHEPPSCPFYSSKEYPGHYKSGSPSPYAEEALALMSYMQSENGDFKDANGFAESLYAWAKDYSGRKNHCTKGFEEQMDKLTKEGATSFYPGCGADDAQANAFWKVPLLVCRYRNDEAALLDNVEKAVRVHQNHDLAVEYAQAFAKMLFAAAVNGATLEEAIDAGAEAGKNAKEGIEKAKSMRAKSAEETSVKASREKIGEYSESMWSEGKPDYMKKIGGLSCAFPGSFVVSLMLALDADITATTDEERFKDNIRRNILLGGDCCGRIPILSTLLAATGSTAPDDWTKKTSVADEVDAATETMTSAL